MEKRFAGNMLEIQFLMCVPLILVHLNSSIYLQRFGLIYMPSFFFFKRSYGSRSIYELCYFCFDTLEAIMGTPIFKMLLGRSHSVLG